jgi:hypothetical protein
VPFRDSRGDFEKFGSENCSLKNQLKTQTQTQTTGQCPKSLFFQRYWALAKRNSKKNKEKIYTTRAKWPKTLCPCFICLYFHYSFYNLQWAPLKTGRPAYNLKDLLIKPPPQGGGSDKNKKINF